MLTAATPEKRVKESEVNVQEEMWKFIAATLNRDSGGSLAFATQSSRDIDLSIVRQADTVKSR